MRIYIHNADKYAEQYMCEKLSEYHILIGTLAEKKTSPYLREVIENKPEPVKEALLSADVVIYQIESSPEDLKYAIKVLQGVIYKEQKTLIVISSVMTWALTPKNYEEEEDEAEEEEEEGEDGEVVATEKPFKPKPYEPFTEEQVLKRKPHPAYAHFLEIEKRARRARSKILNPVVIFSGLQYGEGEETLHGLFKAAWNGDNLWVHGHGLNYVPTIHVRDLASIVQQVVETPPGTEEDDEDKKTGYMFAVDEAHQTQLALAKALQKSFLTQTIDHLAEAETSTRDPKEATFGQVDLKFSNDVLAAYEEMNWHARSGFVKNLKKKVRPEFEKARTLDPLKITILGPPGAGKSAVSEKVAAAYKLPHITIKKVLDEFFAKEGPLKETIASLSKPKVEKPKKPKGEDDDEEEEEEEEEEEKEEIDPRSPLAKAQRELKKLLKLKANVDEKGRFKDYVLAYVYKWKLAQQECRNKGWVVDGFPKTVNQAKLLAKIKLGPIPNPNAKGDDDEEEEEEEPEPEEEEGEGEEEEEEEVDEELLEKCCDPLTLPNYVIQLNIKQKYIEERLASLSPETIRDGHHNEKDFKRRTDAYWQDNKLDETGVLAYLEEQITLLEEQALTTTVQIHHAFEDLDARVLTSIQEFCGEPHHYGVTDRELERVARDADKRAHLTAKDDEFEAKQAVEKETVERAERTALIQQNEDNLAEVQRQKDALLEVKHQPLRAYLMDNVLPILTKGIIEVCNMKPDDPVDYLAEYLFQHTPVNETK